MGVTSPHPLEAEPTPSSEGLCWVSPYIHFQRSKGVQGVSLSLIGATVGTILSPACPGRLGGFPPAPAGPYPSSLHALRNLGSQPWGSARQRGGAALSLSCLLDVDVFQSRAAASSLVGGWLEAEV